MGAMLVRNRVERRVKAIWKVVVLGRKDHICWATKGGVSVSLHEL